jgi:[glutamine synthetase] adenylyltransferase / [glutamine synthetase]-adenylyl-L-tyrosine phosphorylase
VTADRTDTPLGKLARRGFSDARRARELLDKLGVTDEHDPLVASLGDAADPDLALHWLCRLAEALDPGDQQRALMAALTAVPQLRHRLVSVLGASAALGQHLVRHPRQWRDLAVKDIAPASPEALRNDLLRAVGAEPTSKEPTADADSIAAIDSLKVAYRRHLVNLAARDLAEDAPLEDVAAELADLAGAALEAALAIARAGLRADAEPCRLAVIGLGKCGGRELNYVSDVDVVFVAEPVADGNEQAALRTATVLARRLMQVCSQHTAEGSIWEVDAGLRPEGRNGPLVRTLSSHVAYYERWAKTWEFQALMKARPVAGDRALAEAYVSAVAPMVWKATERDGFVEDVQAMRRRVETHIPAAEASRQLKLGPGGLRDVEFAVQLLQLVHGRSDPALRSGNTLEALGALSVGGYVGRDDAASLAAAYRFLRRLEHRVQLFRLRRTHLMPEDEADLRRLGRSAGFRQHPVQELTVTWRRHALEVRRLHEKLFYRPLLKAVARLQGDEARLTPEAARARLEALGYFDPAGALRHIEALTAGLSRRAAIQRTLLPVMLGWFADGPDPDAGLLGFRQVSDALGETAWYLRLLRDEGAVAERMARILASSRFATDLLLRAPEAVAILGNEEELRPRPYAALSAEFLASVGRYDDPVEATAAVRAVRRRELFRIAAADLLGFIDVAEVGRALADVARATLEGGLSAACRAIEAERRWTLPTRVVVIGLGRLGGAEMGYASDADVMFVHDPLPTAREHDAGEAALAVANELRRLLAIPAPDPPLVVDADLRPEGRQGPLVRTIASYAAYYERWAHVWERQALLRADPVAGDTDLGERFCALIEPARYPAEGLTEDQVREIRRIKSRVEAERLPRGADPATHTKLGRGGLSDVEWVGQLLQLRYAGKAFELRTTGTIPALDAAVEAGVLDRMDRDELVAAWRLASRARNAILHVRGRPSDSLPTQFRELNAVAQVLGYGPGEAERFLEDYLRQTRRCRQVVERVFYGG